MSLNPLGRVACTSVAVISAVVALGGCGGDGEPAAARATLPAGVVAQIDGRKITTAAYHQAFQFHRFDASTRVQDDPLLKSRDVKLLTLRPPYADCIAKASARDATAAAEDVKKSCTVLATLARSSALDGLLQDVARPAEARRLGVRFDDLKLQERWKPYLRSTLGSASQATQRRFTEVTGLPLSVLRRQFESRVQDEAVQAAAVNRAVPAKLPDSELRAYYETHKADYTLPASRDIRYIRTATLAEARAAKKAVADGLSFSLAVRRFSNDPATRNKGGSVPKVSRPVKFPTLEKAVFDTKLGEVSDPAKTELGYYVVRVGAAHPPQDLTYEEARPSVEQTVRQTRQQAALKAHKEAVAKRWKPKTVCRTGYIAPFCEDTGGL